MSGVAQAITVVLCSLHLGLAVKSFVEARQIEQQ
jgi:hypothetical protein